jgi:hypothetical protein
VGLGHCQWNYFEFEIDPRGAAPAATRWAAWNGDPKESMGAAETCRREDPAPRSENKKSVKLVRHLKYLMTTPGYFRGAA